jgi:hypothetical protein
MGENFAEPCLIPSAVLTDSNETTGYHQDATAHDHYNKPVSRFTLILKSNSLEYVIGT